jgi:hypothetical protein
VRKSGEKRGKRGKWEGRRRNRKVVRGKEK